MSGEPGHQGVRACVARCCLPCVREGAREGQAQPCHAGCQLQGRRGGRRRGTGSQGGLVTRPASQTEVAVLPTACDGGTDHPEHPPR